MHADVGDVAGLDGAEKACHAVDEGLAADEADILAPRGLPQQMLARAEADLEPDLRDRLRKERGKSGRGPMREVEAEAQQEFADQPLLPRAQRLRFPPAVGPERRREIALCLLADHALSCPAPSRASVQVSSARIGSARSSRSQEKPPSLSGCRPKWP